MSDRDIYDMMNEVRAHPKFVVGTIFTVDDFPDDLTAEQIKALEEQIVQAGFETAECLGIERK